jgi:hypothetical protein
MFAMVLSTHMYICTSYFCNQIVASHSVAYLVGMLLMVIWSILSRWNTKCEHCYWAGRFLALSEKIGIYSSLVGFQLAQRLRRGRKDVRYVHILYVG